MSLHRDIVRSTQKRGTTPSLQRPVLPADVVPEGYLAHKKQNLPRTLQ